MQHIFIVFFLVVFSPLYSAQKIKVVPRKSWTYSLDVYSDNRYVGSIKKELLHINTIYSFSDKYGECARGIAKLFSLGTLSKGFKKIKIYDESNVKIGHIKGTFLNTNRSQYTFTNKKKKTLAVAQLDETGTYVKISHPRYHNSQYAIFEKTKSEEGDLWEIQVFNEEALDPRFFYIFAAFVADSYWSKESNKSGINPWEALLPGF